MLSIQTFSALPHHWLEVGTIRSRRQHTEYLYQPFAVVLGVGFHTLERRGHSALQ
ncbi:MAG: hypothetical protein KME14_11930 [Tildeniella torsiva UHER 1998/13D]|jgi:hypothetical protein|nr:hypothetical protein [Tildeniella torsiva UHER 1998/13D]